MEELKFERELLLLCSLVEGLKAELNDLPDKKKKIPIPIFFGQINIPNPIKSPKSYFKKKGEKTVKYTDSLITD